MYAGSSAGHSSDGWLFSFAVASGGMAALQVGCSWSRVRQCRCWRQDALQTAAPCAQPVACSSSAAAGGCFWAVACVAVLRARIPPVMTCHASLNFCRTRHVISFFAPRTIVRGPACLSPWDLGRDSLGLVFLRIVPVDPWRFFVPRPG